MRVFIAEILDDLIDAADVAETRAADTTWLKAVKDGYNWLLMQDVIEYIPAAHELHVPSATTPGLIYKANGACQCEAFAYGGACWHRACARLVRRALERGEQRRIADRAARRERAYADMAELFPS